MAFTNIQQLQLDEIREEEISSENPKRQRTDEKDAVCDVCMVTKSSKVGAFHICYVCGYYLCDVCFSEHETHRIVSVMGDINDGITKRLELLGMLRDLRSGENDFNMADISVYDRVMIKHNLDTSDCYITGICGLDDRKWAICDLRNTCVKVLQLPTNIIERYIRLGSQPRDITHVKIASTADISNEILPNVSNSTNICLVAVTLSRIRKILLIDISQTPATCNSMDTDMFCYGITFNDNKFYTTCDQYSGFQNSNWYVGVLSLRGETLKSINIYTRLMPNIAVLKDNVYLTDFKHKVQCIKLTSQQRVSQIRIEGSEPSGICVDGYGNIYICARNHHKVYKLNSDLTRYELLRYERICTIKRPQSLAFFKEKIFISHEWPSPLANYIAVVRIV